MLLFCKLRSPCLSAQLALLTIMPDWLSYWFLISSLYTRITTQIFTLKSWLATSFKSALSQINRSLIRLLLVAGERPFTCHSFLVLKVGFFAAEQLYFLFCFDRRFRFVVAHPHHFTIHTYAHLYSSACKLTILNRVHNVCFYRKR